MSGPSKKFLQQEAAALRADAAATQAWLSRGGQSRETIATALEEVAEKRERARLAAAAAKAKG